MVILAQSSQMLIIYANATLWYIWYMDNYHMPHVGINLLCLDIFHQKWYVKTTLCEINATSSLHFHLKLFDTKEVKKVLSMSPLVTLGVWTISISQSSHFLAVDVYILALIYFTKNDSGELFILC
jgi:hypothetical protein